MLSYLKVSDLALVEGVEVEFHPGLNVMTGETGAGKTVLVGAISLLLGDRADGTAVRTGAEEAVLEANFDLAGAAAARAALASMGFIEQDEEELVLSRRLPRRGKGRCTINGRLCPVSALAAVGDALLEVHGQNAHQALLKQSTHIGYLDRFAGDGHLAALEEYRLAYAKLRSLEAERAAAAGQGAGVGLARESELLAHEIEQIDAAEPLAGEIESLEESAVRLRHSTELWELASRVEAVLRGDERAAFTAGDMLAQAAADLSAMASRDNSLAALSSRLDAVGIESGDIAAEVSAYKESLPTDPGQLEQIESRLSLLRELCRKFGGTVAAVMDYRDEAAARLAEIENRAARTLVISSEIEQALEQAKRLADELWNGREKAAVSLVDAMNGQMKVLELAGATFGVELSRKEGDEVGPTGADEVEFLFSPAESEPPRPLRKIASGGEMSRVMLALKIVLADADRLPVLVFDEVDAGIGGETAAVIGERLFDLTRYHQVFCVTHLPQIASFADWQYGVAKSEEAGVARTSVRLLSEEARVAEMCRMLGDSSGRKVTADHAADILKRAARLKKRKEA